MSPAATPRWRSASSAPLRSRVEMMSWNRETTTPMRIPVASRLPVWTRAPSTGVPPGPPSASYRVDGLIDIQAVADLLLLDAEVALVVRVRRDDEWDLVGDLEPVAAQAVVLPRVVGEHDHALDPDVGQDLGADAVVALVDRQSEAQVRLDGVEAAILKCVRAQLVHEPDPAALLAEVHEDPASRVGDHRHRLVQLRLAIAALRAEDVTGEALAVHPDQNGLVTADVTPYECHVGDMRDHVLVCVRDNGAVLGRQRRRRAALDEPLVAPAVRDDVEIGR